MKRGGEGGANRFPRRHSYTTYGSDSRVTEERKRPIV